VVVFLRAFLLAFFGALGWFVWAAAHETSSSCFRGGHYLPSAAIAFAVIIALEVALDASHRSPRGDTSREPPTPAQLAGGAATTAVLLLFALGIAITFAAAVGCSA
jgi:hypothetical protein